MQMYTNSPIVEGLTFDDVLLIPAHSDVLPREVDITTKLTREISLHTPIVSAAMDTVTEADLAIAIAREGGIGVIHKNMPIEVQMEQVRKVKRAENGMIYDPVTIRENATVGDALKLMHENHIGGIPVVDARGMLCGIVTNRDLRFQDNPKTPVSEVMTKENLITTTDGTNLKEATDLLRRYKIEKLLVVDKEGHLAGLITYKDIMKIKDNPTASKDTKGRLLVAAAVGINSESVQKVEMLMTVEPDALVFDTAHGHSEGVLRVLKTVRQKFPDLQIIAGNIATGEAAKALVRSGRREGRHRPRIHLHHPYHCRCGRAPAFRSHDGRRGPEGLRHPSYRRRRYPLLGRHRQGPGRRCRHHHGRLALRRCGGVSRRDHHPQRT